jgi:hypothetical protein
MPVWIVRTTWNEDETEATEQWETNARTVADAVSAVMPHVRFPPQHVEARLLTAHKGEAGPEVELRPGEVRRRPAE